MTVQIQVSVETAKILEANALLKNIDLDAYLRALAEADAQIQKQSSLALEEFDRDMDKLALNTEALPVLPDDFSRTDLYLDHD